MTTDKAATAEVMQKLLEKLEETKPVSKTVRCEGPNGVVAWAVNPEWPPHRKGECAADDYGVWVGEEMPNLLSYIRTLETEHKWAIKCLGDNGIDLDSYIRFHS